MSAKKENATIVGVGVAACPEVPWTRMRRLAGEDATLGELGSLS